MKKRHFMIAGGLLTLTCSITFAGNRVPPLPVGAIDIIKQHTRAETARLKGVSFGESQQHALKDTNRIAGYPVIGKLANLSQDKSQQLARLLLDENNYINITRRCANHSFHGIRFSKGEQQAELYLGIACNQVGIVFLDNNKIVWWGSVLGDNVTREVLSILQK